MANSGDPSQAPIHLDAPSKLVRIIANLAYPCEAPRLDLSLAEYEVLLAICDQLLAPGSWTMILSAMEIDLAQKDPWPLFQFASQRENVILAKTAIKQFDRTTSPAGRLFQPDANDLEGVRPNYYLALVPGRNQRLLHTNLSYKTWSTNGWSTVAERFSP